MGSGRRNIDRTLVALQAVALCCLALAAILRIIDYTRTGERLFVAVTWLALVPIIGALWLLRPRLVQSGHGIAATAVAVMLVTPVAVFGTLGFTLPVLLLVVAFAVVDVSPRAGVHATSWISAVGFILLVSERLGPRHTLAAAAGQALVNVVPAAVALCFGIVLGIALRGFEQRREADRRIINRLQHASEVEKELLLSDERSRSARELHDGLGHRLTLVSMSLELAERVRSTDEDQAWEEIRTAKNTADEVLAEMRTWVRALSPVRDAAARGLAAFELIAESFRGTGLTVDVSGDETADHELANDNGTALLMYRAVQEGLTNALRHGRARSVHIELTSRDRRIDLSITNDFGRDAGADAPDGVPDFGFGLRGLSDRAAQRGGRLRAHRVGELFRLEISVPLSNQAAGERQDITL